jgi:hypothetical protein
MATDDLIAALQGVGRVESEGSFSFDREKAREKLRTFQVAEPQRYVLHFVALAALKGAHAVAIECDSDDLVVRFDGAPITAHDLDDLYNASFAAAATDEQRARQQLAVGLHAALALNPRHVTLVSGAGETAVSLRARHDEPDEIGKPDDPTGGTKIHVKQRFRPGLMVRFVRNLRGTLAEAAWLRARACYATIPITLNGETISQGLQIAGASHHAVAGEGPCSGAAGLIDGNDEAVVRLVRHGVWICDVQVPWLPRGLLAVVANDLLRTDLSGDKVVLDEQHAACLALAEQLAMAVVANAIGTGRAAKPPPVLDGRLTDVWLRWPAAVDPGTAVGEALGRIVTWPDMWRRYHSLAALRAEVARVGHLAFTTRDFADRLPAGDDIVMRTGDLYIDAVLERAFGDTRKDVTDELERRARAEANRRCWRAQPGEPTLTPANYLLLAPLTAQVGERQVTGQVGLRRAPSAACRLRVIVGGCVLAELELYAPIAGVDAVIAGPLAIADDFSGPLRDDLFAACLDAWLTAARDLVRTAVADGALPWPDGPATDELRFSLLRAFHHDDAIDHLLAAAGYDDAGQIDQARRLRAAAPREAVPKDLCEQPWARDGFVFATAAGPTLSAGAITEALRLKVPLTWVADNLEGHPRISQPVLRLNIRASRILQWLFGERVPRLSTGKYEALLGEARHLAKPQRPLGLPADTHTLSVVVEHDGLRVALAFPRAREAWNKRTQRAACDIFLAGRLLTRVEVWSPVPGASFAIAGDGLTIKSRRDGIEEDVLFQEARAKLVAAVPALMRAVIGRLGMDDEHTDEVWRRGVLSALAASFPGKHLRAAYSHLLTEKGKGPAHKAYVKLLALAAASSVSAVEGAISRHTQEVSVLMDSKQLAGRVSAPAPDEQAIADVGGVLRTLREQFGQTGGASWLEDVTTFAPEIAALPLLRRIDGTPVTLAEVREQALGDGLYLHVVDGDARPAGFLRALRSDGSLRELLAALFGYHRLRSAARVEDQGLPTRPAQAQPEPEPAKKQRKKAKQKKVEDDLPPTPSDLQVMLAELQREADARAPAPLPVGGPATPSTEPATPSEQPAAAPPAAPPPPTPGERLVAAIQAELQALRRGHEALLTGFNLDHVRAVEGDGMAMVGIRGDGLVVDVAHPLVQRAIAGHAADRLWVSFLASRVYTALNVWREDITDVDEANFHARHLAWLHDELSRG